MLAFVGRVDPSKLAITIATREPPRASAHPGVLASRQPGHTGCRSGTRDPGCLLRVSLVAHPRPAHITRVSTRDLAGATSGGSRHLCVRPSRSKGADADVPVPLTARTVRSHVHRARRADALGVRRPGSDRQRRSLGLGSSSDRVHQRRRGPRYGRLRRLRVPRAALRRSSDRRAALAPAAAPGLVERDSRRDPLRAELPAEAQPVPAAGSPVRGLPVPERLHPDVAPRREAAGARVDPRRRVHPGRRPQLRRHQARGERHRRRHDQLPARRARLPRAPGACLAAETDRPATTA